jgi:1-acyl-sn-glycerol-3-phosphate acyltransferase
MGASPSRYVVLTKLTPEGSKRLRENPRRIEEIAADAARLGARITSQYAAIGEYDFVSFVEADSNTTMHRAVAELSTLGTLQMRVLPAIAMEQFVPLLKQKAYSTEPHRWQTSAWARVARRVGRHWVMSRHVRRYCRPFEVEGREKLKNVRGPAIIIANHSSHFDTPVVLTSLPGHVRERTAVAAAADKFYRGTKRTWWYSLFWNTFPINRGGGKAALDYPMSLLQRGWSILIYPEGGRSKSGQVQRFRHGVTVMAMMAKVPVVPVYIEGLREVMPKGVREPRPGAVSARIGDPVSLEGTESVPDGTAMLENAMRELAGLPPHRASVPEAELAAAGAPAGGGGS